MHFRTMQRLADATRDELTAIKGISPQLADKVLEFFHERKSRTVV
ncbi:MAG: hypothetical protein IPK53_16465 [bacterium]|nr:hypothetical protein [bacterium]